MQKNRFLALAYLGGFELENKKILGRTYRISEETCEETFHAFDILNLLGSSSTDIAAEDI
jgi:hypothetical protein